ncbi:unnamed protein product [Polarella glacialis]|uniref:Uncharacterized protein n=1 Tax=Polarella glacialis TaxID=89957 RepID=A0A813I1Y7_POLGL|nr:unnamed protein product [Polarella glacialis]
MREVAGEFPVHSVFHASTPLAVSNFCERDVTEADVAGDAQSAVFILRQALAWLKLAGLSQRHDEHRLHMIVLGTNAFFNEPSEASRIGPSFSPIAGKVAAAAVIERYEDIIREAAPSGGWSPEALRVVVGTEGFCRRGHASPCAPGEAQEPYLHASGIVGSLEALEPLVWGLLAIADNDELGEFRTDLSALLRKYASLQTEVEVVPDRHQRIFGSLAEVSSGHCDVSKGAGDGTSEWCVQTKPCCPISSALDRLNKAFHSRLHVAGCSLLPAGAASVAEAPLLWLGDGLAKWSYLLALDGLAQSCAYVARLVLLNHPVDLLEGLFSAFEATQEPGAVAPRARTPAE